MKNKSTDTQINRHTDKEVHDTSVENTLKTYEGQACQKKSVSSPRASITYDLWPVKTSHELNPEPEISLCPRTQQAVDESDNLPRSGECTHL